MRLHTGLCREHRERVCAESSLGEEGKKHAATAADSNLREYGARLFGPTPYQLGCPDGVYVPYIKSFYLLAG